MAVEPVIREWQPDDQQGLGDLWAEGFASMAEPASEAICWQPGGLAVFVVGTAATMAVTGCGWLALTYMCCHVIVANAILPVLFRAMVYNGPVPRMRGAVDDVAGHYLAPGHKDHAKVVVIGDASDNGRLLAFGVVLLGHCSESAHRSPAHRKSSVPHADKPSPGNLHIKTGSTNIAHIQKVVVARHARRMGLGRLIMRELERRAAEELNCVEVTLTTGNPAAIRFYEALGYERERDRGVCGLSVVWMRKRCSSRAE